MTASLFILAGDWGGRYWHESLVDAAVMLGLVVTALGMALCLWRLWRGPHVADRALSVDTLGIHLIALVVLLSLKFRTTMFFDGVLVLSLVGFVGTAAMAQYIGRPHLKRKAQAGITPPQEDAPAPRQEQP